MISLDEYQDLLSEDSHSKLSIEQKLAAQANDEDVLQDQEAEIDWEHEA